MGPAAAAGAALASEAGGGGPARWMCGGYRDVVFLGDCDAAAEALAAALGWDDDFAAVIA